MEERWTENPKVEDSKASGSTKGEEAQVEEQLPVKQKGVGSLPTFPAKKRRIRGLGQIPAGLSP